MQWLSTDFSLLNGVCQRTRSWNLNTLNFWMSMNRWNTWQNWKQFPKHLQTITSHIIVYWSESSTAKHESSIRWISQNLLWLLFKWSDVHWTSTTKRCILHTAKNGKLRFHLYLYTFLPLTLKKIYILDAPEDRQFQLIILRKNFTIPIVYYRELFHI